MSEQSKIIVESKCSCIDEITGLYSYAAGSNVGQMAIPPPPKILTAFDEPFPLTTEAVRISKEVTGAAA